MALTRDFKETIQERARRDAAFREALLKEAVDAMLSGDVETRKTVLRDYINATVGFDNSATVTKKSPKSLMPMARLEREPANSQFRRDRPPCTEKGRPAFESARDVELAARYIGKDNRNRDERLRSKQRQRLSRLLCPTPKIQHLPLEFTVSLRLRHGSKRNIIVHALLNLIKNIVEARFSELLNIIAAYGRIYSRCIFQQ